MNNELKTIIAIISIMIAVFIIVLLLISGVNLSEIEIHRGIKLN